MILVGALQAAGAAPMPAGGTGNNGDATPPTPATGTAAVGHPPSAGALPATKAPVDADADDGVALSPAPARDADTAPRGADDPHDTSAPAGTVASAASADGGREAGAGAGDHDATTDANSTGDANATAVGAPPAATALASVGQPAPMAIGAHAPQTPGLGGAFFALLLVLGLILGLAWLLKRLPGSGLRAADGLRVVASIPLGAKERAAVVQVGEEQLLLGIGPGGVRTLHLLPTPLPESAPAAMPSLRGLPDFKHLLAQRLRKDS